MRIKVALIANFVKENSSLVFPFSASQMPGLEEYYTAAVVRNQPGVWITLVRNNKSSKLKSTEKELQKTQPTHRFAPVVSSSSKNHGKSCQ